MKNFLFVLVAILLSLFLTACSFTPKKPLKTVNQLDLQKYAGEWIEIARYENSFEKGCFGATANYKLVEDYVGVQNRCYNELGSLSAEAMGKAYPTDSTNAKLKVTFFWPFYGDYQVIMLGDDYSYSVVGEPSRKYLWILSRNKQLQPEQKELILKKLPSFGYEPQKLYWTQVRP